MNAPSHLRLLSKNPGFPLNYRLSMQQESKHQHEPSLHWAGLGAGRVASRWGKERMLTIHFLRSFPEGLTFQSLLWPPSSTWKDENVCDVVCPSSTRRGQVLVCGCFGFQPVHRLPSYHLPSPPFHRTTRALKLGSGCGSNRHIVQCRIHL